MNVPLYRNGILVMGPTASGKSALALELARQTNGCIVNMDAMQMYEELPILTAQPTAAEQEQIPHALYSTWKGANPGNAARWAEDAAHFLTQTKNTPLFTGGTGLYLRSLLDGLAPTPEIPGAVLESLQAELAAVTLAPLTTELEQRDPETARRLAPNDTQRTLRALAVVRATGKPLSVWQSEKSTGLTGWRFFLIALWPERETLHKKIETRFSAMMAAGALAEVERLLAQNLPAHLPIMKAHGVPELRGYLAGNWDLAFAAERVAAVTRQYAKRQFTWLRNQILSEEHPKIPAHYVLEEGADPKSAIDSALRWLDVA